MGWVTVEAPTPTELSACVECGLCLPACPTFRLTGKETASPRGRLAAMSAVAEGTVEIDDTFAEIMEFCLECRACEAVCPSLVPFGRAMEGARAELAAQLPSRGRRFRHLLLGRGLASRRLIAAATFLAALAQRLRLQRLAPARLRGSLTGLRPLPMWPPGFAGRTVLPATSRPIGTVALFAGCVMDPWFPAVHAATVGVLAAAGYRVIVPGAQTCCGALAAHDGAAGEAHRLAEKNVAAFAEADLVVVDAAGCGAHLKEYRHWAGSRGAALAAKVRDVSEVVADALGSGLLPRSHVSRGAVAVQDPCHLRHAQRIVDQPRQVLRAAGYRPVDIDPDGLCCGAAGIYSVLRPQAAQELAERKVDQILAAGTTLVASANPGCEIQLRSHLPAWFRVAHPVELYWQSLQEGGGR